MRASVRCFRRAVPNVRALQLRPPIEPRVADVETPSDHPLWQFFGPGHSYMRKASDLDNVGDSWSVPQLRRKSVDDLHTLWFVCMKEMNRLNRELRLVKLWMSEPSKDTQAQEQDVVFEEVREKVTETMWRIRHVLSERYHSWRRAEIAFGKEYPKLFSEFERMFLEADDSADVEVTAQLERFQYAFFGINPGLESNFPNPQLLRGLYTVARLKLARYGSEQKDVTTVEDVREAFLLWTAEHTVDAISRAASQILELRGETEPVSDEMETLARLMVNFREAEASEPGVNQ